jgi:hypothetical protein
VTAPTPEPIAGRAGNCEANWGIGHDDSVECDLPAGHLGMHQQRMWDYIIEWRQIDAPRIPYVSRDPR